MQTASLLNSYTRRILQPEICLRTCIFDDECNDMSFNTQCIKHSKLGSLSLNDIIYDLIIPLIPLRRTSEVYNSQKHTTVQKSG